MMMQECFNVVYNYATQPRPQQAGPRTRFPAVNGAYRDRRGNSCFIGLLIDPKLHRHIEGRAVTDATVINALDESGVNVRAIPLMFLSRLQWIHDCTPPHFWLAYLEKLASDYNLNLRTLQ